MMPDDKGGKGTQAGEGGCPTGGSGAGADSALAAMLKKRQQRADNDDPACAEGVPLPREPHRTVPPAP